MNDTQEFSWSLDCTIWAHLDQQDRKSDKEVLREHSLHVRNTGNIIIL